ncbi:hypothetical protein MMAG44476_34791 [Mycolicibacterium mageritense DSM 44476 = CIP 104973]|uniref:SIR2 family protein n=1 Tax=Mycolicibacterium mageritense TaxID=53462 RepID=A0ABM7HWC9_MYCME|nr:SIR2 family protein [Mycolicibacterium mageritense]MCC9186975.1 SIR2 family protein [Mycolicibacterium mageritense]BBX34856.1 SIR2 family protein [Mycolicibacterium mageritense]CDO20625.1 hypothetical protein BN978_01082 [Mycolicibacterium mageritense DSM 44476 = CIP 104973]
MGGHLFIINGDLTKVACDAVLLPTDGRPKIERAWASLIEGRDHEIPKSLASCSVHPLEAKRGQPQIWLGNVGHVGETSKFSAFAPTVREFVVRASGELKSLDDSDRIYQWPKKRLAVNLVGSGRGGGSRKKGHLVLGLVETLTSLADEFDVDIVLVTFGTKPYAAAQRARRALISTKNLSNTWKFAKKANPELIQQARKLADEAIKHQLVLFIGAGVSAGAGLPDWKGLLDNGAKASGFDDHTRERLSRRDLRDQATLIERELERKGGCLKEMIATDLRKFQRYSLVHGLLASLPSKEAVTTNFDNLFESASRLRGRDISVLPNNPRDTDGHWLLKLHGSIDEPAKMILTRADYLSMPRQYGALMGLVQGLLLMRRMVFVGYSLGDEDFHELIDEVRAARGDSSPEVGKGIALTLRNDKLDKQLWETDLDIVPMMMGANVDIPKAARQLELFLDLVGYLSTTAAAYFLDEDYDDLSESEQELRDTLRDLAKRTATSDLDSVGHLVKEFLEGLGA